MRVLLACSIGGAGHLGPLLPFADAAAASGHETLLVVPPGLEALAAGSGHCVRVGGAPPEAEVAVIREQLSTAPPDEAAVLGDRELFARMATAAMLPTMEQTCRSWTPDLILREPCEYSSAVVATRSGTPFAHVAISVASIEASVLELVAPVLELHDPGLARAMLAAPYLTRFPASMDPSPFPDTRRVAGPPASGRGPLPDWWHGSTAPLVYVSLGTVAGHLSIAPAAYRTALAAVATLDVRVLLTIGRSTDPEVLGPIPDNVHVEQWVPQADILPHASVVVSHGGSGTTFGALAAGLPLAVLPLFADQFTNGRRVEETGAGLTVEPVTGRPRRSFDDGDVARLRTAVSSLLVEPSFAERTRRIAAEMAAAPTAGEVFIALA